MTATAPQLIITNTFSDLVTKFNTVSSDLGATDSLTTTAKNTIVASINELDLLQGNVTLGTDASTVTGAIAEIETALRGSTANYTLTTNATDFLGGINELELGLRGTSNNLVATDLSMFTANNVVSALIELDVDIHGSGGGSAASDLDTSATDLVGAINEIEGVFDASAKGISAGSSAFDITTTHVSGISLAAPITSLTGHISVPDNKEIRVGTGNDLKISHNATNSIITNSTGFLDIRSDEVHIDNAANDEKMALFSGTSVDLYYSNSKKFETKSSGAGITGTLDLSSHLDMPDAAQIKLGDDDDFILQHIASGSVSSIQGEAVRIRNLAGTETMASFNANGSTNLFYDNSAKLATTSDGIDITGIVNLDSDAVIKGGTATAITLDNANVTIAGNTTVTGTLSVGSLDTSNQTVRVAINELHTDIGTNATAIGNNTSAISANTTARTNNATAIGDNTTAIGLNTTARTNNATAIGNNTTAISANTTARTNNANAIGTLGSLDSDISADGNLVVAINELQGDIRQINANGATANNTLIGTLAQLNTDAQNNIVAAINEIEDVFDASDKGISAGTDAFAIVSGTFTVNSTGDINLDADGGDIFLKDNNVTFGSLKGISGNLVIKSGTTTALTFSGANVVPSGTVDGRNISADGSTLDANTTKLSGIEASADVTDTTNVVAALTAGTNITIASNGTISSTDTNTTYSEATTSTFGLVKVGYTENGKNYPVELAGGKMYVNVPWDTDTNTQRAIHDTPVDGATTTSISSNWAFDNVKTAVPSGAVFTDTNTQLSNEQVQDIVGGMLGGTETGITVTYQDGTGDIDFVVASQTDNNFTTALKNKLDGIESNLNAFVEPSQALTTTATTVADAINELKAAIPLVFNASGTQLN
jgi:hypothetical protein